MAIKRSPIDCSGQDSAALSNENMIDLGTGCNSLKFVIGSLIEPIGMDGGPGILQTRVRSSAVIML